MSVRFELRTHGRRGDWYEYSLPTVSREQLDAARKGCEAWLAANPHDPLKGAFGIQVEYGFIYKEVPWYAKLSDFDRLIAFHAIADVKFRYVQD